MVSCHWLVGSQIQSVLRAFKYLFRKTKTCNNCIKKAIYIINISLAKREFAITHLYRDGYRHHRIEFRFCY